MKIWRADFDTDDLDEMDLNGKTFAFDKTRSGMLQLPHERALVLKKAEGHQRNQGNRNGDAPRRNSTSGYIDYKCPDLSRESDVDDSPVNDRFKTGEGFHAVPPPYTGNYMPSRPDLSFAGLDDSVYKTKMSETETSISKTILTKSGQVLVNAAKQRAAVSISTARPVNAAAPKPKVNDALPITYSYFKAHSPVRRPFNQKSAAKTNNFKEKVNTVRFTNVTTAGPKAVVNAAEGNRDNAVKSSACWIWRPKGNVIDHISKYSGSYIPKRFDYGNPQYALQDQGIFDSGCSRHMTGNKFYLSDYQDIDGGFVAFGGSPKGGKITRKGKIRTEN
ncbi:hypothetical protein Tco_0080449 [Tanacetum coccineum]